jgi:type II secretory pathway predicted ATPase ExeA
MVLTYYKLAEQPFGVTPDPRFLYFSETHREAIASALYSIDAGRGFTALIAPPGMGKTTLLFELLHRVQSSAKTVFIFQSQSTPRDLLGILLTDMGIEYGADDLARMHSKLNEALLRESRRGKRLIVVIDEAQNLEDSVLESVRMLSNFETPREKLMHIMLAGQPQLAERLATARFVQLRQRISIVARLKPFNGEESQMYIDHRLRVAGYDFASPLFTKQALEMIAKHSQGIPRNINNICFNALSLGFVAKQKTIDCDVILEVLGDLDLSALFDDPGRVCNLEKLSVPFVNSGIHEPVSANPNLDAESHRTSILASGSNDDGLSDVRNSEKPSAPAPVFAPNERIRTFSVRNREKPSAPPVNPIANKLSPSFLPGWPLTWAFDPDHVTPRHIPSTEIALQRREKS